MPIKKARTPKQTARKPKRHHVMAGWPKKRNAEPARKPRQSRLPGMEDAPIKDLEEAAIEHSDLLGEIRETREKVKYADSRIVALMKKLGKTSYNRGGIRLKLHDGKDSVSVQVKRHDHEASEPEQAPGVPVEGEAGYGPEDGSI